MADSDSGSTERPQASVDTVLQRAVFVLAPLVRLLIRFGVDHPRLSAALKRVFIDEARAELQARGQRNTITALSLLAGLQRRDVKQLVDSGEPSLPRKATTPSLPMQAVATWLTDPRFNDESGQPRALPIRRADGAAPSFEQLADSISKDVHAPAVADELVRLGIARVDHGVVELLSDAFVPSAERTEMLTSLAGSVHDHLAAAVTNVVSEQPHFLEYSLVADELRPESAEAMHQLAKQLWRHAYKRSVIAATEHVARDKAAGFTDAPEMRIRFGVYFYAEPKNPPPQAAEAAADTPGES